MNFRILSVFCSDYWLQYALRDHLNFVTINFHHFIRIPEHWNCVHFTALENSTVCCHSYTLYWLMCVECECECDFIFFILGNENCISSIKINHGTAEPQNLYVHQHGIMNGLCMNQRQNVHWILIFRCCVSQKAILPTERIFRLYHHTIYHSTREQLNMCSNFVVELKFAQKYILAGWCACGSICYRCLRASWTCSLNFGKTIIWKFFSGEMCNLHKYNNHIFCLNALMTKFMLSTMRFKSPGLYISHSISLSLSLLISESAEPTDWALSVPFQKRVCYTHQFKYITYNLMWNVSEMLFGKHTETHYRFVLFGYT